MSDRKTPVAIIKFYRGRGHAENFIKEIKYNFDLKHFPCQKLVANKAYGIIAALAYNLMRLVAFLFCEGKKVRFAKHTKTQNDFSTCSGGKNRSEGVYQNKQKAEKGARKLEKILIAIGFCNRTQREKNATLCDN